MWVKNPREGRKKPTQTNKQTNRRKKPTQTNTQLKKTDKFIHVRFWDVQTKSYPEPLQRVQKPNSAYKEERTVIYVTGSRHPTICGPLWSEGHPVEVSDVCLLAEIISRPSTLATYTPEQLVEVSDRCCSPAKCMSSFDQAFEMSWIVSPGFYSAPFFDIRSLPSDFQLGYTILGKIFLNRCLSFGCSIGLAYLCIRNTTLSCPMWFSQTLSQA